MTARGQWTGHVGFVLAAAGSAVGLGNVWRFPYYAGENGGGAFVLIYLCAVLAVGIPLIIAEVIIGRATARNAVGAFRALRPGTAWPAVGWLGLVTGFVILSYYGVVAGWVLDYTFRIGAGGLPAMGQAGTQETFEALMADPVRQVLFQGLFMVASIVVVSRGIEAGIERASKILMPLLVLFLLVLVAYAMTSPGASEGFAFLLLPRFDELTAGSVLDAFGQAFFSLSVGMGAMITYGSYLERDRSVPRAAFMIAGMDTVIAILVGLVIFPLVFSFGYAPAGGPGLLFMTLPRVFLELPASSLLGTLFFVLVLFAALTSAISLLEVAVAFVVDELGVRRAPASWGMGALIFVVGVPSAGVDGFLDRADALASNYLLPVGGVCIALFTGYALYDREAADEYGGSYGETRGYTVWRACVRYVAPVAVSVILLQKIGVLG